MQGLVSLDYLDTAITPCCNRLRTIIITDVARGCEVRLQVESRFLLATLLLLLLVLRFVVVIKWQRLLRPGL